MYCNTVPRQHWDTTHCTRYIEIFRFVHTKRDHVTAQSYPPNGSDTNRCERVSV